jgi:hypothetical protein
VPANTDVSLVISGLPHRADWPRNVAVGLALVVLASGAYGAVRGRGGAGQERRRLEAERERLFGELTALEESHRADRIGSAVYASRRREIVAALERVYAALDETAVA